MLELVLQGLSNKDIAERLGCTPQCVSMTVNSAVMQNQLARRRGEMEREANQAHGVAIQDARHVLENGVVDAARTHVELLDDQDHNIAQRSATAILDRCGIGSREESQKGVTVVIETEQVNLLTLAMNESLAPLDVTELETVNST